MSLEAIKSGGVKSGVSMQYYALRPTAWQPWCVTSHQVKASHRWWVCNKLNHAEISPDQYAAKIVKISQQMAKLRWKLKWLVFFLGHGVHYLPVTIWHSLLICTK